MTTEISPESENNLSTFDENRNAINSESGIKKNRNVKFLIVGGLLIATVIFILVLKMFPDDKAIYEEKMHVFATNETKALELYKMPKNSSKEKFLKEIKENGLKNWNENIRLVNEMDQLDIPEKLHDRNKKLLRYLELRIASYNLIYKTINEGTIKYNDSLRYYNSEIKAMLDDLGAK
jgi:rhomboid protease GluP